jgi:hypothetical protein
MTLCLHRELSQQVAPHGAVLSIFRVSGAWQKHMAQIDGFDFLLGSCLGVSTAVDGRSHGRYHGR